MNVCAAPPPIVFDLDGTLIDSAPDIHAAANAVLRDAGAPLLTPDQVRRFIGGGVDVLWQRIVAELSLDPVERPSLVAAFMARYHHATKLTRLYPGVMEALGSLADRGHPLGICTNKPIQPTRVILDHFSLTTLFGAIIGGDSLPQKKPDPAPLFAALAQLGDDPDRPRGIFVGDSEFDAATAQNAQLPLLLFTGGYRQTPVAQLPHHAAFDDFSELPLLIEDIAQAYSG